MQVMVFHPRGMKLIFRSKHPFRLYYFVNELQEMFVPQMPLVKSSVERFGKSGYVLFVSFVLRVSYLKAKVCFGQTLVTLESAIFYSLNFKLT